MGSPLARLATQNLNRKGSRHVKYDIDSIENRNPAALERIEKFVSHVMKPYHRAEVRGAERVPDGAGLYVGNHNAGAWTPDTFLFAAELFHRYGVDAVPYALAHEWVVKTPGAQQLLLPLGAVRASHANAHRIFAAGKKVLVYPGGDLDAMRSFKDRNRIIFGGRTGYVRLALREGVPVIPVVAAGAHSTWVVLNDGQRLAKWIRSDKWLRSKVWPLTLSLPWGITLGPLPPYIPFPSKILVEILEPIRFERSGKEAAEDADYVAACSAHVQDVMQATLTRLAEERAATRPKSRLREMFQGRSWATHPA